jgi:WD40 repeat protein
MRPTIVQDDAASITFLPERQSCVAFSCTRLCGQVLVFDFRTSTVLHTIDLPQVVCSLCASPVGGLLAAGGKGATVFLLDAHATSWRELSGHLHAVQSIAFTSDGAGVLSAGRSTVLQWNVEER